jgi:hypothetical protein
MPDDINISFKTTADTSGAEDAKGSIDETKDSLEALTREMKEGEKAAAAYNQQLEDRKGSGASFIGRAKEIALAAGAIAYAARAAGQTIGQINDGLNSINTDALRKVDAAMADTVESAKGWVQALKDPIGALLELTTGTTVQDAFKDVNDSFANLAKDHEAHVGRLIASGIKLGDEMKKLSQILKDANAIKDAKEAADAKEQDNLDKEAIRSGEAPEDVRARRAAMDAQREIGKIDRNLFLKINESWSASDNYFNAVRNRDKVTAEGGSPEDRARAQKQVDELLAVLDKTNQELATAKAVAAEQRRGINAGAEGTIREQEANKAARLQKEQDKANEEYEKANREAALEFAAARKQDAGHSLDREKESLNYSARAVSADIAQRVAGSGRGPRDPNIIAAGGVADALADGTSAKELAGLSRKVEQNLPKASNEMVRFLNTLITNLQIEADKIKALEGQVKNLRAGK